jgi:hypothetical protein
MAAAHATQTVIAWAVAVQERARLVQAKAHETSERLRHALDRTDECFRNHGHEEPELTWNRELWPWDR